MIRHLILMKNYAMVNCCRWNWVKNCAKASSFHRSWVKSCAKASSFRSNAKELENCCAEEQNMYLYGQVVSWNYFEEPGSFRSNVKVPGGCY
jgi:hypothetical protein